MTSYVDDVGSVFYAYVETEDGRECIGGDLAERSAEEMARQFAEAEAFFRGFLSASEHLSYAIYILVAEAKDRARLAREAAEAVLEFEENEPRWVKINRMRKI